MPQFGGKDTKRHFTVVMGGKEHGLYVSSTPSSAARKAVTKLCVSNKSKKVEFEIREITQGSKKKTYGPYEGHIEKLKEPIELKGRVIKYKPVAKLSGKTGAKKGGMRGGTRIYECYTKIPKTDYTFKIEQIDIQYVLTLILNKNNKNETKNLDTIWFATMLEIEDFIIFLNAQNEDIKLTLNNDSSGPEKSKVTKFLSKLFMKYNMILSTDMNEIIDNVTVTNFNGKEIKPTKYINREGWLRRIFTWLHRKE